MGARPFLPYHHYKAPSKIPTDYSRTSVDQALASVLARIIRNENASDESTGRIQVNFSCSLSGCTSGRPAHQWFFFIPFQVQAFVVPPYRSPLEWGRHWHAKNYLQSYVKSKIRTYPSPPARAATPASQSGKIVCENFHVSNGNLLQLNNTGWVCCVICSRNPVTQTREV